ncbi:NAD(P)/FAD-dependent oxidoreductase [Streptomyces sp. NPDC059785]|uniref:NAD(P)/FAD-dependent oxidoreductase n=1 Tax=unclassified Streptomyces TaxID=2593676 RepID=UPI00366829CD
MTHPSSVLVVGASAAGLATAESLRRKGYAGRLTLLGAEPHPPYDRPPLSKQVLAGTWRPEQAHLRSPDRLAALDAEFVLGDPAVGLDVATRTVRTASGRHLRADAVVIATGVRPRALPGQRRAAGLHMLRSLDDALALRSDLTAAGHAVVVGDGVLGAEIAATARTLDVPVTLVGPQPTLMASQLGLTVGRLLTDLHRERGVRLRLGTAVAGLTYGQDRVTGVRLGDGDTLDAAVVVVAIGAVPETDWLAGSGLALGDGVLCDAHGRAADGIYAVGDVARRPDAESGALLRLENRTNATEHASAVAGTILGELRPYAPVPYFWTDQFDAKIHVHGRPAPDDEVRVVEGDTGARRFVAAYHRQGRVTGVLGWNMPKQVRQQRQALLVGPPPGVTADA